MSSASRFVWTKSIYGSAMMPSMESVTPSLYSYESAWILIRRSHAQEEAYFFSDDPVVTPKLTDLDVRYPKGDSDPEKGETPQRVDIS